MEQVPAALAGAYCGADVDATIHLYELLAPRLQAAELWKLYTEIERPLLPVLTDMEMAGVLLDLVFLAEMSSTLGKRLVELGDGALTRCRPPLQHAQHAAAEPGAV